MSTNVYPDFSAVDEAAGMRDIAGALLTIVLITAVLMLVVCAATWAIASANGHYRVAAQARSGVWIALGAAGLAGVGVAWLQYLVSVGGAI